MVMLGERRAWVTYEAVAVQAGDKRGVETRAHSVCADEVAKRWNAVRKRSQQLPEGTGFHVQFRQTGALARDTEKFDVHVNLGLRFQDIATPGGVCGVSGWCGVRTRKEVARDTVATSLPLIIISGAVLPNEARSK